MLFIPVGLCERHIATRYCMRVKNAVAKMVNATKDVVDIDAK